MAKTARSCVEKIKEAKKGQEQIIQSLRVIIPYSYIKLNYINLISDFYLKFKATSVLVEFLCHCVVKPFHAHLKSVVFVKCLK